MLLYSVFVFVTEPYLFKFFCHQHIKVRLFVWYVKTQPHYHNPQTTIDKQKWETALSNSPGNKKSQTYASNAGLFADTELKA